MAQLSEGLVLQGAGAGDALGLEGAGDAEGLVWQEGAGDAAEWMEGLVWREVVISGVVI